MIFRLNKSLFQMIEFFDFDLKILMNSSLAFDKCSIWLEFFIENLFFLFYQGGYFLFICCLFLLIVLQDWSLEILTLFWKWFKNSILGNQVWIPFKLGRSLMLNLFVFVLFSLFFFMGFGAAMILSLLLSFRFFH